ncbi:MAG: AraC family transcriptional regulator [Flavobacteriales bacterium]|nr:AraC family transcriptional regulator [Flavobacteriales bacterium]
MEQTLWVNMTIVRPIIMAAVDAGATLAEICAAAGIDPALVSDPQARVTLEQRYAILAACERSSGEPHLGLIAGQSASPMILGLAGHLMETSATMRDALHGMVAFASTFSQQISFRIEEDHGRFALVIEPTPLWEESSPGTVAMPVDLIMSSAVFLFKLLGGRHIRPLVAEFRREPPKDQDRFEETLRVRPTWRASRDRIVVSSADADLPVIGHNPELNLHFQRMLETQLAGIAQERGVRDEVRRVILQHFKFLLPSLTEVAKLLHVTPRTLQRKLAAEGTSFQRVADEVRHDLSKGMLANQRLTVSEVAYKLGYAEPAAFQRAFKQWTGLTPKNYRAAL